MEQFSNESANQSYVNMGGVVFAGGREMKFFCTVFRDFGKNVVGKQYFQH